VLVKWNARTAQGEHRIPALNNAIDDTVDAQTEKLAIQRRFVSDMRRDLGPSAPLREASRPIGVPPSGAPAFSRRL